MSDLKPPSRWSHTTPMLWYCFFIWNMGDVLFGLDTGSFGSLQTLPSFLKDFGEPLKGKMALTAHRASVMNSMPWIGKAIGAIAWEPTVNRWGYRNAMYFCALLQVIAVIIQVTSREYIQFTAGRVVAYLSVGYVENLVPNYLSEVTPAPIRGFFSGSLLFWLLMGNLWGVGMSKGFATHQGREGWIIPVVVQVIPAVLLLVGVPFTPESPRWLVARGDKEKGFAALNRLRPKREVDNGTTRMEIEAFDEAVQESKLQDQASWATLFKGTYFRRAMIAAWLFIFQQWTGMQFVNSYGPTFYKQMGLGNELFTYQMIPYALCIVTCLAAMVLYDRIGRRPLLILGCALQTLFMFMVAGLSTKKNKTKADINGVVAGIILFYTNARYSLSLGAFVIASEIGGTRMRKKIMAWATFWDVIASFVATFSIPYLLDPPVALGGYVGYIFGGICAASLIFVTFFVPELKNRSLEETDELFDLRLWASQFDKVRTTGVGARIAMIERDQEQISKNDAEKQDDKMVMEHVEDAP